MKSIQESRNVTAHPDLDEKMLVESVEEMEQDGYVTDYCSAECANELIEMWKTLVQSQ